MQDMIIQRKWRMLEELWQLCGRLPHNCTVFTASESVFVPEILLAAALRSVMLVPCKNLNLLRNSSAWNSSEKNLLGSWQLISEVQTDLQRIGQHGKVDGRVADPESLSVWSLQRYVMLCSGLHTLKWSLFLLRKRNHHMGVRRDLSPATAGCSFPVLPSVRSFLPLCWLQAC